MPPLSDPSHRTAVCPPAGVVAVAFFALLLSLVPAVVLSAPAATADGSERTARKKHHRAWSVPAPRKVRAVDTSRSTLTVTWREPRGADRYRIQFSPRADLRGARNRWTSRDHFRLTGLEPGTRYHVRVRAVDGRRKRPVSAYSTARVLRTSAASSLPSSPTTPEVPTPSSPPSSGGGEPLWGANYSDLASVDESLYGGRAEVARIFFQGLSSTNWASNGVVRQARRDGIDTFVISWKERDPENVARFLATIPDGLTIYACFHHEPENDAGSPGSDAYRAWSTEWKRLWGQQSPIIRAEGFIPTSILMAYTLIPKSGRKVSDWTPPAGAVDVFAFDGYLGKHDPVAQVERMSQAARDLGIERTGLAETGSPTSDPDRAAKLRTAKRELAAAGNFEWAIYWNAALNGYDSRLDAETADIWFG